MTSVPDCLVLKIEEIDYNTKKVDTTVYIFYDANAKNLIRQNN